MRSGVGEELHHCNGDMHPLRIDVLTLAAHRRQVWVRLLVDRLTAARPDVKVRVLDAEEATVGLGVESKRQQPHVLINRVSDAAAPALAKATVTLLSAAEARGVRVINGSRCYGIGMSKLLHHVMLDGAGLATPRSVVCRRLPPDEETLAGLRFPVLFKPNSGGFGAGIVRLDSEAELKESVAIGAVKMGEDGMCLLQEYVAPARQETFRVWVAGGTVQCGVRIWHSQPDDFGGCMSAACRATQGQKTVHAWRVPTIIEDAVLRVMAACQADCGSIEFLYPEPETSFLPGSGRGAEGVPLFFDVNMLSTLPLPGPGGYLDQEGVWPEGMDPWTDLAHFILEEAKRNKSDND
eukprot:CAMPEP_0177752748 /NCGR_PEP_ID=MMETSP0491_2-20121128/1082_1 /TAXON_ID=63592 /ORGANISM="Tetraselmis chuii, Strain PLY429" /LENGTH=350 /DNA_ID=CAMNT_0019267967 /DNA_START=14 /DNA_END=1064 /DNA_ORIENTATION=-